MKFTGFVVKLFIMTAVVSRRLTVRMFWLMGRRYMGLVSTFSRECFSLLLIRFVAAVAISRLARVEVVRNADMALSI